jgi:hypothetical protein
LLKTDLPGDTVFVDIQPEDLLLNCIIGFQPINKDFLLLAESVCPCNCLLVVTVVIMKIS